MHWGAQWLLAWKGPQEQLHKTYLAPAIPLRHGSTSPCEGRDQYGRTPIFVSTYRSRRMWVSTSWMTERISFRHLRYDTWSDASDTHMWERIVRYARPYLEWEPFAIEILCEGSCSSSDVDSWQVICCFPGQTKVLKQNAVKRDRKIGRKWALTWPSIIIWFSDNTKTRS